MKARKPSASNTRRETILTSNCKSDCRKARALGELGKGSSRGRLREKRVGGLCLPSQPSGKLSPPRLRHQRPLTLAHLDSCVTFTPIPSTSNLPPAQILALKNLKLRVLLPYTVSLSHIQSPLSCVTAKGDVTSLWLRPPSPLRK